MWPGIKFVGGCWSPRPVEGASRRWRRTHVRWEADFATAPSMPARRACPLGRQCYKSEGPAPAGVDSLALSFCNCTVLRFCFSPRCAAREQKPGH